MKTQKRAEARSKTETEKKNEIDKMSEKPTCEE